MSAVLGSENTDVNPCVFQIPEETTKSHSKMINFEDILFCKYGFVNMF